MKQVHQEEARRQLAELLDLLRCAPARPALAEAIEVGEQLERAIAAFHMEGIRFRMFTLGRLLHRLERQAPAAALAAFEAVRSSLEAAGFHTRSVPH
jgi:hypothetical protein